MLKTAIALSASVLMMSSACAEPAAVTAAEIKTMLSGNSIEGTWSGDEYRQYFSASGSTTYSQRDARKTVGKWRVNEQTNKYESWWERAGWSGYGVIRDGEQLFWTSSGLEPQPFKLIEGQHVDWD